MTSEKLPPAMITLRDAGRLMASVLLDGDVPQNLFDGNHERECSEIRKVLMDAFKSEYVGFFLDQDGDDAHRPNPEDLKHFASGISASFDKMTLGATPGEVWNVEVNRYDLLAFIQMQLRERQPRSVRELDAECLAWLVDQMQRGVDQRKPYFKSNAARRFGTAHKRFEEAWKKAIGVTGKVHYSRPGRPKNPQENRSIT
ncbi:hypothetical protein [Tabrizicola sp. BL-A-41-H6]|uniref:hypothetical protein n=1 Tax=Tabrizicola sp. BL-A-41-H6 TaxID=3421107 RepID=UPI003D669220